MKNLKSKMCNYLLENNLVEPYDVINTSYSNARLKGIMHDISENNICPTLGTRCDCLGVVVIVDEEKK